MPGPAREQRPPRGGASRGEAGAPLHRDPGAPHPPSALPTAHLPRERAQGARRQEAALETSQQERSLGAPLRRHGGAGIGHGVAREKGGAGLRREAARGNARSRGGAWGGARRRLDPGRRGLGKEPGFSRRCQPEVRAEVGWGWVEALQGSWEAGPEGGLWGRFGAWEAGPGSEGAGPWFRWGRSQGLAPGSAGRGGESSQSGQGPGSHSRSSSAFSSVFFGRSPLGRRVVPWA